MGDIQMSTGFWRYTDKGFRDMDFVHDVLVKTEVAEKRSGVPIVYVGGDFNGDKRPDLVVVKPKEPIGIHMGQDRFRGNSKLIGFEANASLQIPIGESPDYIQFIDLNSDGISDMQCQYSDKVILVISNRKR